MVSHRQFVLPHFTTGLNLCLNKKIWYSIVTYLIVLLQLKIAKQAKNIAELESI